MSFMPHSFLLHPAASGGPPTDYVAYYTVDDISGSTLVDQSVNGYDGTINGATLTGGYLEFDGVNDYVDLSSLFAAISADTDGTVIMKGKIPAGGRLYFAAADSADSDPFLQFFLTETLALYGYKENGAAAGVDNFTVRRNDTYSSETDYVLAFVQDATAGVKIYLDGSELTINQTTGTPGDRWFGTNPDVNNLAIGRLGRPSTIYYEMDFLYLYYYDRNLSSSEIAEFT